MISKPTESALILLGLTSLVGSRAMFLFIDDPEGPNLLVVGVVAAVVYAASLAAYTVGPVGGGSKRLWFAIFIQGAALLAGVYFLA